MILKDWTLHFEDYEPLSCQAPCSLYSVLLQHDKIQDPFWGLNEQKLTALSEKDCTFTAVIPADAKFLGREYVELTFEGLDTICDIYLNDTLLGHVKNMHRAYTFEVKSLLHEGENALRLEFKSPVRYFTQANNKHYLYMNGDSLPGASHLRKALYMSGWDWGPTLPDMGIWRPVELNGYDGDKIDAVAVRQHHVDGKVRLEIETQTRHNASCEIFASIDGQRVRLEKGSGSILIENPRLWWVRGYGEQNLYDLELELVSDGQVIDRVHRRLGLRTLTVSTERDKINGGNEFCFVNNGVKIFAMGANYVPQDNLLSRVTPDRMDEMMKQCLDANFNCLRVWGGGVYPDDYFFQICDENGILVWLDFMVACANIWLTTEFEQEFAAEAEYNLKRLHHHASLGIVCGNNEMEVAVMEWDGVGDSQLVRQDYIQLYEHLLPEIAEKYAPDTFYWPSSPSSGGGFEEPGNPARGDTHYWDVWHGGLPFSDYRQHSFRFCSEYGFESFPSMKTIRSFCNEEDWNCFSRVMENHQKCKGGNGKILRYLADQYLYPHSFENLVYASQLLQADAIKYGVEHFRRQRGYCMGSVYWQFNDCWPVASWSSVDSLGRYKALHYAARKFYAPIALGLFLERDQLTVNVSNETRQGFSGSVRIAVCQADMSVLAEYNCDLSVDALCSKDVFSCQVTAEDKYSTYVYADLFDENGVFLMRQAELLAAPKHFSWLKPEFRLHFKDTQDGVEITVQADVFAKGVYIDFKDFDCVLSDNFFNITSTEPYHVKARTEHSARELEENVLIKSVYDIR